MGFIPHASIPIHTVRPNDIILLLLLGFITELLKRIILRSVKFRSSTEKNVSEKLIVLRYETAQKRSLGPSAFVETSKLERRVLAVEKELSELVQARKDKVTKMEKKLKYVSYVIAFSIFVLYYGIAVITVDGIKVANDHPHIVAGVESTSEDDNVDALHAATFLKGMLFPISYIGLPMKISRLGLENKASSLGALAVFWSAQEFTGKIYECLEVMSYK
jgi:hypothetical protein